MLIDFVTSVNTVAKKDTFQDACSFLTVLAFVGIVAAYIG